MKPERVRLRAYAGGHGHCVLLSIYYDNPPNESPGVRPERHVLVDLGSDPAAKVPPVELAPLLAEHCGGSWDLVLGLHPAPAPGLGVADQEVPGVGIRLLEPPTPDRPARHRWWAANQIVAEPAGLGAAAQLTRALAARPLPRFLGLARAETEPPSVADSGAVLLLTIGRRVLLLAGGPQESWSSTLARVLPENGPSSDEPLANLLGRVELLTIQDSGGPDLVPRGLLRVWDALRRPAAEGRPRPVQVLVTGRDDTGSGRSLKETAATKEVAVARAEEQMGLPPWLEVHRVHDLPAAVRWVELAATTGTQGRFEYAEFRS